MAIESLLEHVLVIETTNYHLQIFTLADEIVIPWNVTITFHYWHWLVAGLTIVYIHFLWVFHMQTKTECVCVRDVFFAHIVFNTCKSGGSVRDVKIISAATHKTINHCNETHNFYEEEEKIQLQEIRSSRSMCQRHTNTKPHGHMAGRPYTFN